MSNQIARFKLFSSKSRACARILRICTGQATRASLAPEGFWLCISSSEQSGAGVGVAGTVVIAHSTVVRSLVRIYTRCSLL